MYGSTCAIHFKFHKVVYRHYSGEVENVYIILQQICSGNYIIFHQNRQRFIQDITNNNYV